MTREFKNLQGEKLQTTKKYMKMQGFKYFVSYNPTHEVFYFVDRFFKTKVGADKFFNNLNCDKKILKTL